MFLRGTAAEYETWHTAAKLAEGIPFPSRRNGEIDESSPWTTMVVAAIPHPGGGDDCIWEHGTHDRGGKTSLTKDDLKSAFPVLVDRDPRS